MIKKLLSSLHWCFLWIISLAGFTEKEKIVWLGNIQLRYILSSVIILFICVSISVAVKVYPNPWIPESGDSVHGNLTNGITFGELQTSGGKICIYNITGEFVREVVWETGKSIANWDGKDDKGEYVASGVYLWTIKDTDKSKTSKIVVIR